MGYVVSEAKYDKLQRLESRRWVCGYCSTTVSSNQGYRIVRFSGGSARQIGGVYICPNCQAPTYFSPAGEVLPSPAFGNAVESLPNAIESAYDEARRCTAQQCYTAAVLVCRKILMNMGVDRGVDEKLHFIKYVDYLADKGYVPPNGTEWVDQIRTKGNEATQTHEIPSITRADAEQVIIFTEMLLRHVYELPAKLSTAS